MSLISVPGIYKISHEEYHGKNLCPKPALSRSTIHDLLFKSPAHARYNNIDLNPAYKKDNDRSFDLGKAAHEILLEGGENIQVIEAQDWRKKDTQEAREIALKEGKSPLLTKQYQQAVDMVSVAEKAIRECKELGITNLRSDGDAELSYIWQEGETWIRVRPDWISGDRKILIDYKTSDMNINPDVIARHIATMGLQIQAGLYLQGVKAIEKVDAKFIFVFQETSEPYLCSFISLTPQFLELGNQQVDYGKYLFKKCLDSNTWPGFPQRVCYIEPPAWYVASWEEIASRIGE